MTNVPLPKLRNDLLIENFEENGESLVAFSDELGIASQSVVIPKIVADFVQILDGKLSIEDIRKQSMEITGENFDTKALESVVMQLEARGFMDSARTRIAVEQIQQYLTQDKRPAICVTTSYPDNPDDLKKYLDEILSSEKRDESKKITSALAPHIDFRIGEEASKCYGLAFQNLTRDADLAVIFGTAHNRVSSEFMLTKKNYTSPLGEIQTDYEIISGLENILGDGLYFDDLAHRIEHSIEFHALFLQHIFDNKIKILPVLTGGMFEYLDDGNSPNENSDFMKFINALRKVISDSGKKVIFLASGDLAHIGRKFGDDFDAETKFEKLKNEDDNLVKLLEKADKNNFLKEIYLKNNSRNICGLAPFYSLLECVDNLKNGKSAYGLWDEQETKSAVSFASVIFE
jgi:MEMO1 family protein